MGNNFSEEFKVSIIADASDVDTKIQQSYIKLNAFKDRANQQAQIKLRVDIAELESKIADARKRLQAYRQDGDKAGEIKTRMEISGLQEGKNQASKVLRDLRSDADNTGKSFFSLSSIVTDAIKAFGIYTAVRQVAGALKDAFDASVQFESAFAGIKKTVQGSDADFAKLSDGIIQLSKDIPVTAVELSNIGQTAGQLGVKQKDILGFTKTVAAIGVSTNLSAQEAATAFARIANIYQEPISKVSNLASSVVALGNNFATTESEIVAFTTRIAGAGKIAGLSTADIAGISAAFTSVGIEAEAGGTAVSKTLQSISDAVVKGGKDLNNFASVAGVSAKTFTDLWKSDPAQALNLFIQGLGKSGEKASGILDDLVAGDQRLKRAFLSVANAGDLLTRSLDLSKTSFEENNALTTEAEKRYATTESQLIKLGNRWAALQIQLGNFLKEAAVPVLDFFVTLSEALAGKRNEFSDLAEGIKTLSAPLILTWKALVVVIEALGKAYNAIKDFRKSLTDGSTSATILNGSLSLLGNIILGILSPLTQMSNGILNLVGHTSSLDEVTKNLKKTLTEGFTSPIEKEISSGLQSGIDKAAELKKTLDGLKESQIRGFGNDAAPQGQGFASGSTVNQAFDSTSSQAKQNLDALQQSTRDYLAALGLTSAQITDVTSKLDIFNGSMTLGEESQNRLMDIYAEQQPLLAQLATQFQDTATKASDSGKNWSAGIKKAVDEIKVQYGENKRAAEVMARNMEEKLVENVAKTGDLGTAAAVAYGSGFGSSESRRAMENGAGKITDIQLLKELKAAEMSGEHGKAAGLLLALGFGDKTNLAAVANSSNNLHDSIQKTFSSQSKNISATGKNAGGSLVAGIINGINSQLPGLASVLSRVIKSIGGLANVGSILGGGIKLAIGPKAVATINSFANKAGNIAAKLQSDYNALGNTMKDDKFTGFGGGGGGGKGGKGLDEAKTKAEEIAKAVDDWTKKIEDNNKAAEKLRDETVKFYKEIQDSIDKAREKQGELRDEMNKTIGENNKGLAEDAAKREAKLTDDKIKAEEELKKLKEDAAAIDPGGNVEANATANANALAELSIAQERYNKAVQKGDKATVDFAKLTLDKAKQKIDSLTSKQSDKQTEEQNKKADADNKVLEKQKEIEKIANELSEIEEYKTGLIDDQTAAQKAYDDAVKSGNAAKIASSKQVLDQAKSDLKEYEKVKDEASLSDFGRMKVERDTKNAQTREEKEAEIKKQQDIIDIQERFKVIQAGKTAQDRAAKKALIALATTDEVLTQQQKQDKLKALGFNSDGMTVDQTDNLLKQVAQANALDLEFQKVSKQQSDILAEKQKYQDMAQQYHADSVDKMKAKEQELIDLIKEAQREQAVLNSLKGTTSQAAGSVSTTTVNVTNNNTSNVDAAASNSNLLRKIK